MKVIQSFVLICLIAGVSACMWQEQGQKSSSDSGEAPNLRCQKEISAGGLSACWSSFAFIEAWHEEMCGRDVTTYGYLASPVRDGKLYLFDNERVAHARRLVYAVGLINISPEELLEPLGDGFHADVSGEIRCIPAESDEGELEFLQIAAYQVTSIRFAEGSSNPRFATAFGNVWPPGARMDPE